MASVDDLKALLSELSLEVAVADRIVELHEESYWEGHEAGYEEGVADAKKPASINSVGSISFRGDSIVSGTASAVSAIKSSEDALKKYIDDQIIKAMPQSKA